MVEVADAYDGWGVFFFSFFFWDGWVGKLYDCRLPLLQLEFVVSFASRNFLKTTFIFCCGTPEKPRLQ